MGWPSFVVTALLDGLGLAAGSSALPFEAGLSVACLSLADTGARADEREAGFSVLLDILQINWSRVEGRCK